MNIGILGCGNIGSQLAAFADRQEQIETILLFDKIPSHSEQVRDSITKGKIVSTLFEFITKSDLIIECAHPVVVVEAVEKAVDANKSIMVMSMAGLLGNEYLFELARKNNTDIYLPSGAIGALDAIKALSLDDITSVTLVTTKHPRALHDSPYVADNSIDLSDLKEKKTIFEGSPAEAGKAFPQNINVAATLQFASAFPDVKVRIVADPDSSKNSHEIRVQSKAGELYLKVDNVLSANKRTSQLAVLSAITRLKEIMDRVHIGT